METYGIDIAGVHRELVICKVNERIDIAAFIMFGDVELTVKSAEALLKKCPEHDIVVTAETKGIPLAYEMAKQGCGNYLVARKSVKLYMKNPISIEVRSITTDHVQTLYISGEESVSLKGKRVLIADDVISTGESLAAMENLVKRSGGIIAGKAAVLAEGDAINRDDIIYLEPLPLFYK